MLFRQLIDLETSTYTYLIADEESKQAILVDSVKERIERDLKLLEELGLRLAYTFETHVHADHIMAAAMLKEKTGCLGVVPKNANVACSDIELDDGETIKLGNVLIKAIATPGHTDSHNAYLVDRLYLLTGDSLLIRGCGRTDFQSGNSALMFNSVTEKFFKLPGAVIVCPGHDYNGFTMSTIHEEISFNPRFKGKSEAEFVELMNGLNLPNPKKMMEAVPANQKCGGK
jgi:glyoxylase-like metal-dependent hydrolase (beta-lactamase superfamily II)